MAEMPDWQDDRGDPDVRDYGQDIVGGHTDKQDADEQDTDEQDTDEQDTDKQDTDEQDTDKQDTDKQDTDEQDTDEQDTDGNESDSDTSESTEAFTDEERIEKIPRRFKNLSHRNFDHFPRILINQLPENVYDRTCAICFVEYETSDIEPGRAQTWGQKPERAAERPCCGKTLGEKCLLHNIGTRCPFCRRELADPSMYQDRGKDIRRWLCWILRRRRGARASATYDQFMDLGLASRWEYVDELIRAGNDEEANRVRDSTTDFSGWVEEHLERDVREYYDVSDGVSSANVQQWQWNSMKAAAAVDICQAAPWNEAGLIRVAAAQITDTDLREYIADDEYGVHGSKDNYRLKRIGGMVVYWRGWEPPFLFQ